MQLLSSSLAAPATAHKLFLTMRHGMLFEQTAGGTPIVIQVVTFNDEMPKLEPFIDRPPTKNLRDGDKAGLPLGESRSPTG